MERRRKSIVGIPIVDTDSSSDDDSTLSFNLQKNFAKITEKSGDQNGNHRDKNKPNLYEDILKHRNISPRYKLRPSIVERARIKPINKKLICSTPLAANNNNNCNFGSTDEDGLLSPITTAKDGVNEILATTLQKTNNEINDDVEIDETLVPKSSKSRKRSPSKDDTTKRKANLKNSVTRQDAFEVDVNINKSVVNNESVNRKDKHENNVKGTNTSEQNKNSLNIEKENSLNNVIKRITALKNICTDNSYSIDLDENCSQWKGIKTIRKHTRNTRNDIDVTRNLNNKSIQTTMNETKLNNETQTPIVNDINVNNDKTSDDVLQSVNDHCLTFNEDKILVKYLSDGNDDNDESSVSDMAGSESCSSNSDHVPNSIEDYDEDDLFTKNGRPWRLTESVPNSYIDMALQRLVVPSIVNFTRNNEKTPSNRNTSVFNSGVKSTDKIDVNVSPKKKKNQSNDMECTPKSGNKTTPLKETNLSTVNGVLKSMENVNVNVSPTKRKDQSYDKGGTPKKRITSLETPVNNGDNVVNRELCVALTKIDDISPNLMQNDITTTQVTLNKSQNSLKSVLIDQNEPMIDNVFESNSTINGVVAQKSTIHKTLTPKNNINIVSTKDLTPVIQTRSQKKNENEMLKVNNKKKAVKAPKTKASTSKNVNTTNTSNLDGTGLRRSTRERKQTFRPCLFKIPKSCISINEINEMSSTIINQRLNEINQPMNQMSLKKLEISARTTAYQYLLGNKSKMSEIQSTSSQVNLESNRKQRSRKKTQMENETGANVDTTDATTSNQKNETVKQSTRKGRKPRNGQNQDSTNEKKENAEKQTEPVQNAKGRKGTRGRGRKKQVEESNDNDKQENNVNEVRKHNEINNLSHNRNININQPETNEIRLNAPELSPHTRNQQQSENVIHEEHFTDGNEEFGNFEAAPVDYNPINENFEMDRVENDPVTANNDKPIESQLNDSEIRPIQTRNRSKLQQKHNETSGNPVSQTQKTTRCKTKNKQTENNLGDSRECTNHVKLHNFLINTDATSDTESQQQLNSSNLQSPTRNTTLSSKRNGNGSVQASGRISKKYKQNIVSMEVLNNTFNDLYHSLHIKWKHGKNMHKFGSSKPHFTAVENGKIGVTVRKENGDGSMGYIVVNSNSTMNFDAENYSIFCNVIDGNGKLVIQEKNFIIEKLMNFIIEQNHSFTIVNLNEEKDLVIHFVRHS